MKVWLSGIAITLGFWILVWFHIGQPAIHSFDEFHYIPAAKAFLGDGPIINTEHPPLAKIIIAQGISLMGDTPKGWRLMSSIFGALTLAGLYFWAFILFGSLRTALFVTVLSAANQMLYVQSRIAMLDTFMAAFLVWAAACFSFWWRQRDKTWVLFVSAICFGLAVATKWFAVLPLFAAAVLLLRICFKKNFARPYLLPAFALVALLSYALCFAPIAARMGNSWSQFLAWQIEIWSAQQRVTSAHPYSSSWWGWPLQLRPIWYCFEATGEKDFVRAVILLGNPILLWGGFLAMLYCAWLSFKKSHAIAREVLLAYAVCWLGWALIPRKVMFFYYYYPAALVLGMAWAVTWEEWRAKLKYFEYARAVFTLLVVSCFIYFLPVLGLRPISTATLRYWAWFLSWI